MAAKEREWQLKSEESGYILNSKAAKFVILAAIKSHLAAEN